MRAYPLILVALALLAGTAGYVTHQALDDERSDTPGAGGGDTVAAASAAALAAPPPADDDPLALVLDRPQGGTARIADIEGRVLVVNFWATWCPPCLREIPAFIELQHELGARGVQFVGIALDQADPVQTFAAEKGMNYPVMVGDERVVRIMTHFGNVIGGLPYTVVLDPERRPIYTHQGEWTHADARALLDEALQKFGEPDNT